MRYWLFKTEPSVFSLAHLQKLPQQTTPWEGVRNYQARNLMRDEVQQGDGVLFYHSSCPEPGVVARCEVVSPAAYPDPTQYKKKSDYYDPGAKLDAPRWLLVDVRLVAPLPRLVSLATIKATPALATMLVVRRGMRLSIQPVQAAEWHEVLRLGGAAE